MGVGRRAGWRGAARGDGVCGLAVGGGGRVCHGDCGPEIVIQCIHKAAVGGVVRGGHGHGAVRACAGRYCCDDFAGAAGGARKVNYNSPNRDFGIVVAASAAGRGGSWGV